MMTVHKHAAARRQYRPRRTPAPVTVRRVREAAWMTAVTLAGGDTRRLRVVNDSTVLVLNPPPARDVR